MEEGKLLDGTIKLYYEDAYRKDFSARVLSSVPAGEEEGKMRYAVVLDRTAFFPEEGGQCADRGELDGVPVLDVRIRNGVITHITAGPLKEGGTVEGRLDFARRFSNMQQHSAEHLFSGIVKRTCGFDNVGFRLSDSEVTMDYGGVLTKEQIAAAEEAVNRAVWENIESKVRFLSGREKETEIYRSKIGIEGEVRVVSFPGYDDCACCAPHVARTGEIGLFKVVGAMRYKGGTRISMLAGDRAYKAVAEAWEMLTGTARDLSTAAENVPGRVRAMQAENAALRHDLREASAKMLLLEMQRIAERKGPCVLFTGGENTEAARAAVESFLNKNERVICAAVFCGSDEEGYRYVLGGSGAAEMNLELRTRFGGKGGGKPPLMQGAVRAAAEELAALFPDAAE